MKEKEELITTRIEWAGKIESQFRQQKPFAHKISHPLLTSWKAIVADEKQNQAINPEKGINSI
jgi:hypothetical protein